MIFQTCSRYLNITIHLLIASVLSLSLAAVASNQNAEQIEQLIVTGVYTPQPANQSTSNILIIDRQHIEAMSRQSVTDLLEKQPGLLINQQGGMGGVSEVSIRGAEPNFTNVYVNNVKVNDPLNSRGGSFNFNSLDAEVVDRIEILKNPASTVHGSGALAGVINVLIAQPSKSASQVLSARLTEGDSYATSFKATGTNTQAGYGLLIGTRDSGGSYPGDNFRQDSLYLTLEYDNEGSSDLVFNAGYRRQQRTSFPEQGGGPLYAVSNNLERGKGQDITSHLRWNNELSDVWQTSIALTYLEQRNRIDAPGIVPFTLVPPTNDELEYQEINWQWINSLGKVEHLLVHAGLNGSNENGTSHGFVQLGTVIPTDFSLSRQSVGAFVSLSWRSRQKWMWLLSQRIDQIEKNTTNTASKIGFRSPLFGDQIGFSGSWGRAYKLPSFIALAHPLVGNSELRPEKSEGWEISVGWRESLPLAVRFSLFSTRYKDLIDFDANLFQNVNRDDVKTSGFDLGITWEASNATFISYNLTFTDINLQNKDSKLTGRSQWSSSASLNQKLDSQWEFNIDLRWSDERYATSLHQGMAQLEELDGALVCDAQLSWKVSSSVNLTLGVENLFNRQYSEAIGFPAPGARVNIGFRWSL